MTRVENYRAIQLSETDFVEKIQKLDADLKTGKMWMNDHCITQKKSPRVIRWIKCILSILLPINLFSSIKASRVAFSYYEWIKRHQTYLQNESTLRSVKQVLFTLNDKTKEKYEGKILVCIDAINGLAVPAIIEPKNSSEKPNETEKKEEPLNIPTKTPPNLEAEFDKLIDAAQQSEVKEKIRGFKQQYLSLDNSEASKHTKEKILINLDGMNADFPAEKLDILRNFRRLISADLG